MSDARDKMENMNAGTPHGCGRCNECAGFAAELVRVATGYMSDAQVEAFAEQVEAFAEQVEALARDLARRSPPPRCALRLHCSLHRIHD